MKRWLAAVTVLSLGSALARADTVRRNLRGPYNPPRRTEQPGLPEPAGAALGAAQLLTGYFLDVNLCPA